MQWPSKEKGFVLEGCLGPRIDISRVDCVNTAWQKHPIDFLCCVNGNTIVLHTKVQAYSVLPSHIMTLKASKNFTLSYQALLRLSEIHKTVPCLIKPYKYLQSLNKPYTVFSSHIKTHLDFPSINKAYRVLKSIIQRY